MENKNEHNHQDAMEKAVLEKINSGEVKMKPKSLFVLKVVALALLSLLVFITSSVLVSFMIFSIRVSGRLFLLGFGWRGLLVFFLTFPWFVLLADAVFILLFERLLKHFKFAYRTPLAYTLLGSTVVVIILGVAIDRTSLHRNLMESARMHHLGQPIGAFYMNVRRPPREDGVFSGIVSAITGTSTFSLAHDAADNGLDGDVEDSTSTRIIWTVVVPPNTNVHNFIQIGDKVLVAGDVAHDSNRIHQIHAYGIRKIAPGDEQ